MKRVCQLFRASSKPTEDGAYSPSTLALAMATSPKMDFDEEGMRTPIRVRNAR